MAGSSVGHTARTYRAQCVRHDAGPLLWKFSLCGLRQTPGSGGRGGAWNDGHRLSKRSRACLRIGLGSADPTASVGSNGVSVASCFDRDSGRSEAYCRGRCEAHRAQLWISASPRRSRPRSGSGDPCPLHSCRRGDALRCPLRSRSFQCAIGSCFNAASAARRAGWVGSRPERLACSKRFWSALATLLHAPGRRRPSTATGSPALAAQAAEIWADPSANGPGRPSTDLAGSGGGPLPLSLARAAAQTRLPPIARHLYCLRNLRRLKERVEVGRALARRSRWLRSRRENPSL